MTQTTERERQSQIDALGMSRVRESALDALVQLAAKTFDAPIALISVLQGDRQWFKSKVGLKLDETPRTWSFCDHAIRTPDRLFVVEDASKDERFASNPLVTGDPGLRFYAASPLKLASGQAIGALCVMDTKPRQIDAIKLEQLRILARNVVLTLEPERDER